MILSSESCKKIKEFETKYSQLKIKWQEEQQKVKDLENNNKELSQEVHTILKKSFIK